MQINVGTSDRIVRTLIGLMPLLTGLAGRCPGYRLLGLNTCPMRKQE